MKHTLTTLLIVGGLVAGAGAVQAGSGCCPASGKEKGDTAKKEAPACDYSKKDKAACGSACSDVMSKLDLSKDQKKKVESAMKDCSKAGCTEASSKQFMTTLKTILTPEQYTVIRESGTGSSS